MDNTKISFRDILRNHNKSNFLFSALVAVFFAAVIVTYNVLLLNSVNENMVNMGQISAERSATTVDSFLSDCSNALAIVEYTLDDMINSGAPDEEILDFMIQHDASLKNTIGSETTKLYSLIGGRIFDGKQCVIRDPDYVPAERPWYRKAMEDKGNFVLVDPYKDVHTGNILMTISKTMSDGESVVMFDVSLEHIQQVIEQQSASSANLTEMVLDSTYSVVAHSDTEELGRSYLSDDEDSIGAAVAKRLTDNTEQYFNVSLGGHRYTAYIVPVHGGWVSISAVATSDEYMPIRIMFMVSIAVSVLLFATVIYILVRNGTKEILAGRLNSQLSSAADIYLSLSDIDIINNSLIQIKNFNPRFMTQFKPDESNVQETFNRIMESMPDTPTKQAAIDFVDLSTLEDRLAEKGSILLEYQSHGYRWVRARFVVSERTPEGKLSHVLWMLEDIDAEKKDREKLIDISERAVAANEAKSSFLSNMSHEIRTPINAVLGMNEMVLRESDDPAVISYSESIRTAGNTLLGLINDILDFSKIEAGKMEIIPVDYDLATVFSDLVNMIQTRLDNKGLMLVTEFDSEMPHFLHGDEVRIKQVITNILTNAAKYTEKGSVTFSAAYEKIPEEPDSIMLKVSIKDTGIGIKQEDMAKLFSKFERIEEERNRNVEGTGLGMNITQRLLEMMDSRLEVSSVYGEGSTFGFSLKQQVRKWDKLGNYEEAHRSSVASRKKYQEKFTAPDAHILVVDDTVMNLLVFTSLLKSTQVRIDTAESGDDGILLALKNKYDIIFLDHMMPHKDGIETLKELKAAENNPNRDTPVICLTANAISGAREKYLEAGFDDYLTKPIESVKLEEMVCEYLPKEKLKTAVTVKPKEPPKSVIPDAVFNIIELDAVAGINTAGSEEMYLEMLLSYSDMMHGYVDKMTDYWLIGDIENTTIMLHSLKGASRTIGAEQIRRLARKLETAGNNGDTDVLNKEMDDLIFMCRSLGSQIAAIIGAPEKK